MRQRQLGELVDAGDGDVDVVELGHDLQHPAGFAEHRAQPVQLLEGGETAGHRPTVRVDVDEAGRQADRAGLEAVPQQIAHGGDLVGARGALLGHVIASPPSEAVLPAREERNQDDAAQLASLPEPPAVATGTAG